MPTRALQPRHYAADASPSDTAKGITGGVNNEFDRVSLQTYYVAIRDGLPDKPFEAPLPRLRQWIAEKLHEMSPITTRARHHQNPRLR